MTKINVIFGTRPNGDDIKQFYFNFYSGGDVLTAYINPYYESNWIGPVSEIMERILKMIEGPTDFVDKGEKVFSVDVYKIRGSSYFSLYTCNGNISLKGVPMYGDDGRPNRRGYLEAGELLLGHLLNRMLGELSKRELGELSKIELTLYGQPTPLVPKF